MNLLCYLAILGMFGCLYFNIQEILEAHRHPRIEYLMSNPLCPHDFVILDPKYVKNPRSDTKYMYCDYCLKIENP